MKKLYQNKPGVIILGGHVQGYGIVRIFGESNISCVVIDSSKKNIARHSKYCKNFYLANYETIINLLNEFALKNKYKDWLIFPTDDYYVRLLSKNKEELDRHFKVTVDRWEVVNIFFDKTNSYPLAEKAGVPIPKTFYPQNDNDLQTIQNKIGFPCIIKPAIMKDFYSRFKKKVFICKDNNELINNFKKACSVIDAKKLIIQEIIPGSSYNQYSVGIFYDKDKTYNCLVANRSHQHPIDFGNATTYAETVDLPILIEYAEKILKKANFFGLCEVEFKYDNRDKEYKFLEVNPRTWKWHLIGQIAGNPFLMSMFNFFTTGNPIVRKENKIVAWKDLLTDFPTILQMKKKGLYKKTNKLEMISAVYDLRDIKPFIFQMLYIPYNIFKR